MLDDIFTAVLPVLVDAALAVVIPAIVTLYYRMTKTQLDKDARERLHSAMRTGALMLSDKSLTRDQKVDAVLRYAQKSVPEAIERLKPAADVLESLIISKLNELIKERENG